eukprot:scaffold447_cov307-Pinguiococcus_pyrenoidosus.AAC.42
MYPTSAQTWKIHVDEVPRAADPSGDEACILCQTQPHHRQRDFPADQEQLGLEGNALLEMTVDRRRGCARNALSCLQWVGNEDDLNIAFVRSAILEEQQD